MTDNRVLTHKHDHDHGCGMHHISAMAIFTGALVALGLGFLANVLSLAIGLTAFSASQTGTMTFATSGFVWLVVLAIITMFIAGWVTGFLARPFCFKRKLGEIYGFSAWSLALILTIILTANAGQFLSQRTYLVDRANPAVQLTNELAASVTGQSAKSSGGTKANTPIAEAENLGTITFATFFILFIGALSATFGGRVGIRDRKKEEFVQK